MKVTIIIPVYNVESYIKRCFDSVAAQSYEDIECIFVDDYSPDNCNAMIQEMITAYDGKIEFNLIRHEQNKGLSGARNTGTRAAIGEYIFYLDSDDQITPEAIETLVSLAKKYPRVDVVQGNTETIPQPGKNADWRNISLKGYPEYCSDNKRIKREILKGARGIPMNAWNKLLRREFLIEHKLLFYEGIIHEDVHWVFFVAKRIKSIAFTTRLTLIHHITEGSIMQSGNTIRSIGSFFYIAQDFVQNVDPVLNRLQWCHIRNLICVCMMQLDKSARSTQIRQQFENLIKEIMKANNSPWILNVVWTMLLTGEEFYRDSFLGRVLFVVSRKMSSVCLLENRFMLRRKL